MAIKRSSFNTNKVNRKNAQNDSLKLKYDGFHRYFHDYSGAFIPTNFSGNVIWIDFSDATTLFTDAARTTLVSTDGASILGVTNLSGSANHAAASASNLSPKYRTNVQNGLSTASFDGTNDFLKMDNLVTATQFTVAGVWRIRGNQTVFNSGSNGLNGYQLKATTGCRQITFSGVTDKTDSVISTTAFETWVLAHATGATCLIVNGTTASVGNPTNNPTALTASTILGAAACTTGNLNGDIGELILYDSALSLEDRQSLDSYLNSKWAVY